MKRGDIALLFDKYGPIVYRRARYFLGNHVDAEEATQETFIRALKTPESFDGRCGVDTWLVKIATNYCLNQLRDRKRRADLWDDWTRRTERADSYDPEQEQNIALRRLLAEADVELAQVAVHVLIDGMSHREVADLLGVSKRTVGNYVQRFIAWAGERLVADHGPGFADTGTSTKKKTNSR